MKHNLFPWTIVVVDAYQIKNQIKTMLRKTMLISTIYKKSNS